MRCSCPNCDTYMIQAESMRLGCVCPNCGTHCSDCLGTNTVISKEDFKTLAKSPFFAASYQRDLTITPDTMDEIELLPPDPLEKLRGE